jgi:inner membrane protein
MDTLTQGLLGAVTSQCGFRQRIGRDAAPVAAGVAVLADLDILAPPVLRLFGGGAALSNAAAHRGVSHSLLAVPVIALAAALPWWLVRRRRARRAADAPRPRGPSLALLYACCLVAALSHPVLDWCTSYGTQLLAPLTDTRYALDAIGIIDVIYTPLLVLTLVACWLWRRRSARPARATVLIGWAGLLLSCGYIVAGRFMHDRVMGMAPRAADGRAQAVRAYPMIGTIFLWRLTAETDDRWYAARVRPWYTLRGFDASAPKPRSPWVRRARRLAPARRFDWFAMGETRAAVSRTPAGRPVVELHDMRYGVRPGSVQSLWFLRITFDRRGRAADARRVHAMSERSLPEAVGRLWREIWAP